MTIWSSVLRDEARDESYKYFDQKIRKLFNLVDGAKADFHDNDVDAFRHAYVSGVFTQVYGEAVANIFGRLNEKFLVGWYPNKIEKHNPKRLNMELWNNEVFYDLVEDIILSREEFVRRIEASKYPDYTVKTETPVSRPDGRRINNLG